MKPQWNVLFVVGVLQTTQLLLVSAAKQQLKLSDSYLPVAMQIIAHLTDQMSYEAKDEYTTKPTTHATPTTFRPDYYYNNQPIYQPYSQGSRPTYYGNKPYYQTSKPTYQSSQPLNYWQQHYYRPSGSHYSSDNGWSMSVGTHKLARITTNSHKPGLYAPLAPPKPSDRLGSKDHLLPPLHQTQYTVIKPQETRSQESLLSIEDEEVRPLVEPAPSTNPFLPPHFDTDKLSRSDSFKLNYDMDEEHLQYLSQNVRDIIRLANDPDDDRIVDIWDGARAGSQTEAKASLSASNLRLLLLYDQLSREAKRLKLSDYTGFSDAVIQELSESSSGGARAQLSFALSRMLARHDCEHEYANNRAREMVQELAKDDSKLSSELRYLQPLVYKL